MSCPPTIGIGVLGLGFMGRTHLRAYATAIAAGANASVLAVCDRSSNCLETNGRPKRLLPGEDDAPLFDPQQVTCLTELEELFARKDIQLVSICTPTDSHVDLAIAALRAGKNVLLEKPVALSSAEVQRLIDAEATAPGFCLPAMCMRFWPGWSWLKPAIETGRYGKVLSASFRRLCARPDWSPGFYDSLSRSGGALFDLHIHDVDLVQWLFGTPNQIQSAGDLHHITTTYTFPDGPTHVSAQGGWNHTPGFPFQMHYTVIFEEATADYNSTRDPALQFYQHGQLQELEPAMTFPEGQSGYDGEIRHALEVCQGATPSIGLGDALALAQTLERERTALG